LLEIKERTEAMFAEIRKTKKPGEPITLEDVQQYADQIA
jgi:hypothetical protein